MEMKPKIKSIPYEEWNDNESLAKIVDELHEGGVNVVTGSLDKLIKLGPCQLAVVADVCHQLLRHRVHGLRLLALRLRPLRLRGDT